MSGKHHQLLATIARADNEAADQAIGFALLAEDGRLTDQLAGALLERGTEGSVCYVVRAYHRLDQECQQAVVARCPGISGALRLAAKNDNPQARRNVITIIAASCQPSLTYLLSWLLHDQSPAIRTAAAGVFKALAESLADRLKAEDDGDTDDPHTELADSPVRTDLRRFCIALEPALETFGSHLRTEVVESAMYLARHLPQTTWAKITEPGGRIGHTAGEILLRQSDKRFAGFAFRAFTSDDLVRPAAKLIAAETNTAFLHEWLAHADYRFDQACRKRLAWIRGFRCVEQSIEPLLELPASYQITFIDILLATSTAAERKVEILNDMLKTDDPAVEQYVLAVLVQLDKGKVSELVAREVCSALDVNASPTIQATAEQSLQEFKSPSPPDPDNSHHRPANACGSREDFAKLWSSFDRLDRSSCRTIADRLRQQDGQFLHRVSEKLTVPAQAERLMAITLVRKAGLATYLAEQIYELAGDPDRAVRSAAVAALADIPARESAEKLIEALDDNDPRVQANAIEALEAIRMPNLPELLEPKLASGHNRIRANAIKAILKPQYILALRALAGMLDHAVGHLKGPATACA